MGRASGAALSWHQSPMAGAGRFQLRLRESLTAWLAVLNRKAEELSSMLKKPKDNLKMNCTKQLFETTAIATKDVLHPPWR